VVEVGYNPRYTTILVTSKGKKIKYFDFQRAIKSIIVFRSLAKVPNFVAFDKNTVEFEYLSTFMIFFHDIYRDIYH
jgi:hypothetical protein